MGAGLSVGSPSRKDETMSRYFMAVALVSLLVTAPASWALNGWDHTRPLTVTNPGSSQTAYEVKVVLDVGNFDFDQAQADGADLRVTEQDLVTLLPHWIETWDAVAERAVVWVRVDGLEAQGTRDLVLNFGNPTAPDASDGTATFLFYSGFEELAAVAGLNAPTPLITPTYDGSGQVVHPDVVQVPGGWNGYEYWMGMTPYPNGSDIHENPSVLVSNDNQTWIVPPGLSNPLAPTPPGHNDDVDMLLIDGQMILYYVETNDDDQSYVTRFASTDGADWGMPLVVLTLPNYVMSPAVVHNGTDYLMWYLQSPAGCTSSYQNIYLRTSSDGIVWGPEQTVTLVQPGRVPWHFDVQLNGGLFTMLFISYPDGAACGNTQLYYAESADGLDWTINEDPILQPSPSGWDSGNIYRASFTQEADWLRIWYSAVSSGGQWRVGYTEGEMEDFRTQPMTTWSEVYGTVQGTTEHPRSGTHGLRQDGGSTYPQVFGALEGSDVCVNVWYWEEMSSALNFMALLRLWDTGNVAFPAHCIGTGVWTGASTTDYSTHTEGFAYTPTSEARSSGWRHLSIAAVGGACELRIDDLPVATLDVLDASLIDRFSVEGYRGGTGYFDDAYVRHYADPEPMVAVGSEVVSSVGPVPATRRMHLEQNVPNPLNPETLIAFSLPRPGFFSLEIIDLRGRVVRTLLAESRNEGRHEAVWDGRDGQGNQSSSGVYFYRLTTAEGVVSRKLTLVK